MFETVELVLYVVFCICYSKLIFIRAIKKDCMTSLTVNFDFEELSVISESDSSENNYVV